jgi:hypothetical protein
MFKANISVASSNRHIRPKPMPAMPPGTELITSELPRLHRERQ